MHGTEDEEDECAPDLTPEIHNVSSIPLNHGGLSDVYFGTWRRSYGDIKVALKVVRIADTTNPKMIKRLNRETALWYRLFHANIHIMFGVYRGLSPLPAMVSPWCSNGDINHHLSALDPGPETDVIKLKLLTDVLTGLKYRLFSLLHYIAIINPNGVVHGKKVVHADIKGANVLVSDDGVARLCDFGFSKVIAEQSEPSADRTNVKGTYRWMAPELVVDEDPCHTVASDIWACGCLFIEVQCGVKPYNSKRSDQQVIIALSKSERPERPHDMPDTMWLIVLSCCAVDAKARSTIETLLERMHLHWLFNAITRDLVNEDSLILGATALLASVQRSADISLILESSTLRVMHRLCTSDALESASHDESHHIATLIPVIYVLRLCAARAADGYLEHGDSALVSTTIALVAALQPELVPPSYRCRPETLRPLARILADSDKPAASHLMECLSSPNLGYNLLGWSPIAWLSGAQLASASYSQEIDGAMHVGLELHSLEASVPRQTCKHMREIYALAISHDGKFAATGSAITVHLWDVTTGTAIGAPMMGHEDWVGCLAFSSSGAMLVSGSFDHTVRIWNIPAALEAEVSPLSRHPHKLVGVSFASHDRTILSSSSDGHISVWDSHTGAHLRLMISTHNVDITATWFPPSWTIGTRVVTGSEAGFLHVVDVQTGSMIILIAPRAPGYVAAISVSPDGRRIASCYQRSPDIYIWDADTGALLHEFTAAHRFPIAGVAFADDGRRIASSAIDGTTRIWDLSDSWKEWDA